MNNYWPLMLVAEESTFTRIEEDRWCGLPDLVLEKIFSYLNAEQKYYCSLTCSSWNRGFYLPYAWSTFVFKETTLTTRKFNYYSGWQVFKAEFFKTKNKFREWNFSLSFWLKDVYNLICEGLIIVLNWNHSRIL